MRKCKCELTGYSAIWRFVAGAFTVIESICVDGFAAVSHLESSRLMQKHQGRINFSTEKVNVIVGPNGSGKTALLDTLSMRLMANMTGESALNDAYVFEQGGMRCLWRETGWRDYVFMPGARIETDNGPAVYYRPRNVPGGESSIAAAMMVGYEREAREYSIACSRRSSGEAGERLLEHAMAALNVGAGAPKQYGMANWRFGSLARKREKNWFDFDYKSEKLRELAASGKHRVPVVLMDEPEQSLDARSQARLWEGLRTVRSSAVQVIVATHSIQPMMDSERFHLIECETGYVNEVLRLSGVQGSGRGRKALRAL